jgi:K+-sensing histidine kinase KdpD
MEVQRGNITYEDLDINTLDRFAGEILKNPKLKIAVVTAMAYMNMTVVALAEETDALTQLRVAKNEIVHVLQFVICIICIVMCLIEIGKALIGGRGNDIGSIVMKYLTAVVAVCVIPNLFTWIGKLCHVNF